MAKLEVEPAAMPVENPMEEEVELYIPRESGSDPYMFVGLNGVRYLFPRGKTSKMPAPVAAIIKQSLAARDHADEYSEEQERTSNQPLAYM